MVQWFHEGGIVPFVVPLDVGWKRRAAIGLLLALLFCWLVALCLSMATRRSRPLLLQLVLVGGLWKGIQTFRRVSGTARRNE